MRRNISRLVMGVLVILAVLFANFSIMTVTCEANFEKNFAHKENSRVEDSSRSEQENHQVAEQEESNNSHKWVIIVAVVIIVGFIIAVVCMATVALKVAPATIGSGSMYDQIFPKGQYSSYSNQDVRSNTKSQKFQISRNEEKQLEEILENVKGLVAKLKPHCDSETLEIVANIRNRGVLICSNCNAGHASFSETHTELLELLSALEMIGDVLEVNKQKGKPLYYSLLSLDMSATQDDIKRAYRSLMTAMHPDKNVGNKQVEELAKLINEAYSILSNPDKRREYDSSCPC